MKELLINLLFVTYCVFSAAVLCLAILYGFIWWRPEIPLWHCLVLYPVAAVVALTQKKVLLFFDAQGIFESKFD